MKRKMTTQFDGFLDMIRNEDYLVLDTETTGLHEGEICSIAIIDNRGTVLLDTLVKPVNGIPAQATAIHGITEAKVALAQSWLYTSLKVAEIITEKNVVIYNAVYDRRMMYQSVEVHKMVSPVWRDIAKWHCAMENYAEFWGDWNDYHMSYRWQRLTDAVAQQGLIISDAHAALGDCKMTLALCKKMAEKEFTESDAANEGLAEDAQNS